MKRLILYLLIFVTPFLSQAQSDGIAGELQPSGFYLFDITETWDSMGITGGWSVGNAWNEPYAEYQYYGTLDFQGEDLEMMNSKLRVYGDTLNIGTLTLRYPQSDVIVEPTLSNEEPSVPRLEIKMYPNPADVDVTFAGEYVERVTVYDMNGKIVYRGKPNSQEFTIITSNWASGMYTVQLFCLDNRGIFKKLIVK